MANIRVTARQAITIMAPKIEAWLELERRRRPGRAADDARDQLGDVVERLGGRAALSAWLHLGGACITLVHQRRGIDDPDGSIQQLATLVSQHWRRVVGAVDYDDGATTVEELKRRDVWDLPTMALLAGHPPEVIPATLVRLTEGCGAVATGDVADAARVVSELANQQFSGDLAETLVLGVLVPQVARDSDAVTAFRQAKRLALEQLREG